MAKIFTTLNDTELVALLRAGAVGVIPTDTVYGLVSSVYNAPAVTRMYGLKAREKKPGTSIAASVGQLAELGIDPAVLERAAIYWPNSISIVMAAGPQFSYIHQGLGDSPFRVVKDSALQSLLTAVGPLVTTSANDPGQTPATNFKEAQNYFGDSVDFYVDGIELTNRPSSTIIRINEQGTIDIIREGAVRLTKDGRLS
jgi:L-threonylcarbamoyladenylate synthase